MNTRELVIQLKKQGVELWVDGNKLRYRAPVGIINPAMRELLENRKADIIDQLNHAALTAQTNAGHKPLSFAQRRIWFFEQLLPGSPAYNAHCVFRITGRLSIAALQDGLNEIVQRHSILRSECINTDSGPVQKVSREMRIRLRTIALPRNFVFDRDKKVREIIAAEVRRPFDLLNAPFLRATLLKLDGRTHIFILVTHHFVMDGYSLRVVFMKELSLLYAASLKGKPSPLPKLSIQFHDYVENEQREFKTGKWKTQVEYWRRQLDGVPLLMQLPTYHGRSRVTTYRGAVRRFAITNPLSENIKTLSRKVQATLFMTYLAAFHALLHRYTHAAQIVTGTTISHRPNLKTEDLIGPLANNLVLVSDVSDNPTFADLCKRIYDLTTEAYSHQDLPFEKLVESLQPERNLSHNPIFQILFVFHENSRDENFQLCGTRAKWLPVDSKTSRFDLSIEMENCKEEVAGAIEYNTDLYSAGTVDLFVEHWLNLLRSVARNPDQPILDINFLTAAERKRLAPTDHSEISCSRSTICLHELFERQVEKKPEAYAVVYGQERMTFYVLNQRANTLARYLKAYGAGPDDIVGICCDRSTALIVGLMGILKAGAAYLPLDPTYPLQRLSFMIKDAQIKILITEQGLTGLLPEYTGKVVVLNHFTQVKLDNKALNPRSGGHENHLAYLIYTSGSTGRPKGVAVEHRSVTTLLNWAADTWSDQDRVGLLASTSICFDLSIFEIFLPLCFGGCVVLVQNIFELSSFRKINAPITLINSTPSLMVELLRSGTIPETVRTVNLAGEKLPADLPAKLYNFKNIRNIYNLYGPSEDTVYTTYYRVPPGETRNPLIGGPIPGTEVFVLDGHRQPVPYGVTGELCIAGKGLARGYWNRRQLSAERFVNLPFDNQSKTRVYFTGDLVRKLPDGNLEYLGRCDEQIKFHGIRIEPGEIESVLRQHADVCDAAVIVNSNSAGVEALIAYVVFAQGKEPSGSELRSFLRLSMPEHMIPSIFLSIAAIPVTTNGKIDLKALPKPDRIKQNDRSGYHEPRNVVEKAIVAVWMEVLNLETVGIHTNFFDVGGHSLILVRVKAKLKTKFNVDLPLVELFKYPTVFDLAKFITQQQTESNFYFQVYERADRQINAIRRRKKFFKRRIRLND